MVIDHLNGDISDNRIANLRLMTRQGNIQKRRLHKNNTSGYAGVGWNKPVGKWMATIKVNGKRIHLLNADTKEEAYAAYLEAKAKYHGLASLYPLIAKKD